jgi:hypothetical protein
MRRNIWKVILVFSVMLLFAVSGELAAQVPDDLDLVPSTQSMGLSDAEDFTAILTSGGINVQGDTIYFSTLVGLGGISPSIDTTDAQGEVVTTYTAGTVSGVDTLQAMWISADDSDTLVDIAVITVNPDPGTRLNVTPTDTVVVVTEDATIVAEIRDAYGNHVDATSASQVAFTTSGLGTLGAAAVNADNNIEVAYTTDDSMATDTVTAELVSNGVTDFSIVSTIGEAPASMDIYASDSTVIVSNNTEMEYFWFYLYDEYGNPSAWADWYGKQTYRVVFTVSEGGGVFHWDTVWVYPDGSGENGYYSSTVAGVYTITGTSLSGTATDDIDITQEPDDPDSLVLTPDSIAIPAGTDTTLTATMYDQYGNHVNAQSTEEVSWGENGDGSFGSPYIDEESNDIKRAYYSYRYDADTAQVWVQLIGPGARSQYHDTVTVFSAEPGDLDHFDIDIECGIDTSYVSDGVFVYGNWIRIEAQDGNNIRLWTYSNSDTMTLTLNGSTAGASQVTWFVDNYEEEKYDTVVGLTAPILPLSFSQGLTDVRIANQVAETATVTATDTSGHTGTSPGLTWLPIDVVGFDVRFEGDPASLETFDTVNVEVTAIDEFGNTTEMGLPLNVVLSANRAGIVFPAGATQLMETSVDLFPTVATAQCTGLVITVADIASPSINGSSDPIDVLLGGVEEGPVVSSISAKLGGDIVYAVGEDGDVTIKVYNKAGMEVGTLVDGPLSRGYYQASLKGLNLASDVYFVVMKGPGIDKGIKAVLIK